MFHVHSLFSLGPQPEWSTTIQNQQASTQEHKIGSILFNSSYSQSKEKDKKDDNQNQTHDTR